MGDPMNQWGPPEVVSDNACVPRQGAELMKRDVYKRYVHKTNAKLSSESEDETERKSLGTY